MKQLPPSRAAAIVALVNFTSDNQRSMLKLACKLVNAAGTPRYEAALSAIEEHLSVLEELLANTKAPKANPFVGSIRPTPSDSLLAPDTKIDVNSFAGIIKIDDTHTHHHSSQINPVPAKTRLTCEPLAGVVDFSNAPSFPAEEAVSWDSIDNTHILVPAAEEVPVVVPTGVPMGMYAIPPRGSIMTNSVVGASVLQKPLFEITDGEVEPPPKPRKDKPEL